MITLHAVQTMVIWTLDVYKKLKFMSFDLQITNLVESESLNNQCIFI